MKTKPTRPRIDTNLHPCGSYRESHEPSSCAVASAVTEVMADKSEDRRERGDALPPLDPCSSRRESAPSGRAVCGRGWSGLTSAATREGAFDGLPASLFASLASFAVSKGGSRPCVLRALSQPTSHPKQNNDTMKTYQTQPNHDSRFKVRHWIFDVPRSRIAWRPALSANSIASVCSWCNLSLVAADVSPLKPPGRKIRADSRRLLPSTRIGLAAKEPKELNAGHSVRCARCVLLWLTMLFAASASAATRCVWQSSPSPAPPYTNWDTAAHVIQDAVDAADPGDTVLVTNGVYATGGRTANDSTTNRVLVDKPLNLYSLNGPEVTIIQGYQVPGRPNGHGAGSIRCVYLTNGATLSGFTLADGGAASGGGVYCESTNPVVSDCVISGNSAGSGGGAYKGTLSNCILVGNSAVQGGGTSWSVLNDCTLTANSAWSPIVTSQGYGGGSYYSTLNNCTLTDNSADSGGGDYRGTLKNCTLSRNFAGIGGGAFQSALNNSTVTCNAVWNLGGGAYQCTLTNCSVTGNSANSGGGVHGGTLNNCTLTGNYGVGAYGATLNNCIVYFNYFNTSGDLVWNYSSSALNYCCTTPLPTNGIGNVSLDPQLADISHLSAGSPCIGAGSAASATGTDVDGEAWANPPSIGCDEYHAGAVTGPLNVRISATYTNVTVDFPVALTAVVEGRTTGSVWDLGNGMVVSNQPYATRAWTTAGAYEVVLRAYNEGYPTGVSATLTVQVMTQAVYYVAAGNTNPVPPYSSWATAATNIQDAVDAVPMSLG